MRYKHDETISALILNDAQVAKFEKSIPLLLLPRNLWVEAVGLKTSNYSLYLKKYIIVGNVIKKFNILKSLKGHFIGYQKHFKSFDLMVRFKSYAYFYAGR